MRLTLIGQSTVMMEFAGGPVLITDPWFKSFSFLRVVPAALRPDQIAACDAMLVSHKHVDHIDRAALHLAKRLGSIIVGPPGVARFARRRGFEGVRVVAPGDALEFEGTTIHATGAFHPVAKDAVGFVVEAERVVYFSGDTRLDPRLVEEVRSFGVEVALLQIASGRYLGKEDGMNMEAAAALAHLLEPAVVVPVHYQVRGKALDPRRFLEFVPPPLGLVLEPGRTVEV